MRRGLAAAAASAVVALSLSPLFAPAADAQGAVSITPSPITMAPAPDGAANVTTNLLAVSGHFHVDGGFQSTFDWARVNLGWRGTAPGPPIPGPYTICGTPPQPAPPGAACAGQDVDFKDQKLQPAPAYNGPYAVNATAHASDKVPGGGSDDKTTNTIAFNIVVPPPNVDHVTAAVDKDRNVTVSWDRDANTPDLQADVIWRKGPGDKDFTAALVVVPPKDGARVNAPVDGKTLQGGDYLFQVEARRNGATGDGASYVPSDRTAKESLSNKVTVPPPPPGQTVPPTTSPKGGSPPVVKGTPSGVNRNSSFSGSSSATTPTSEAVVPDPGFARGLPYAGANPSDQNNSEGDNSSVAVTPGRHSSSGRGYLSFVAGGAVLFLGALHLRILKKRLDEPPTNLTPVA